jgi:trimeric autotransporter adhesin
MKYIYKISLLFVLALCLGVPYLGAQTVYTNTFPGTMGGLSIPFGSPNCYPTGGEGGGLAGSGYASGIAEGGWLGSVAIPLTPGYLSIWGENSTGTSDIWRYAYFGSPLAPYAAPFNPTLSLNDELITWTFNMRTSKPVNGFTPMAQTMVMAVLVTSDIYYRFAGNGYAVVYNPSLPRGFQIVRFNTGVWGTVTPILTSAAVLSSPTNYASIKVVYQQSIDEWTLYVRDDGPATFADPSTGVTAVAGSVIDGTYTSTPMTGFGFYAHFWLPGAGPDGEMAYFDNYTVTMNCPKIDEGGLNTCIGLTTTLTNPNPGGTWTSATPSVATIGSASGIVTGMSVGTSRVTYTVGTCTVVGTVTVNPLPAGPAITGTLSICAGETTTLSTTPPPIPGTWSSSTTTVATVNPATGVVTGISGGTAIISYTVPTGCFSTITVTITAIPPAITGAATVCIGRTTLWSNANAGGTWSSTDGTVATVGSSTGLIGGIVTGTSTISYVVGPGCATARVMTVIASPAAITGTASMCEGATTTLSNATAGGTWTSGNTGVATVDISTGVVTGVLAGTATITYTAPNGCFATVVTTVNPIPGAITGTPEVCVGAATTLSSSPGGGAWSSSDLAVASVSGASGTATVTGVAPGTADITYTRLGCVMSLNVTVHALPALIGGANSVCIGSGITITDATPGGTWSSSNTTVATIGSSSGTITTVATGTTTITYRLTTTACFRTRTITVNPLPGAIGGPTALCPASSVTLTCTPSGGTWASGNTAVATIVSGTGVLTGVATGTVTISYTSAAGCVRTTVVTVSTAPPGIITPIGDTVLCPGDFVTLTSSTSPGVTYEWYIGGVLIPSATSSTYVASVAGSYQVRLVVAAGCSTTSIPMAVTVVPAVATITVPGGVTTTCAGTPIALNANTGAGLTYQWQLGGAPIAGATASTFNALTGGSYKVRVTNSAGCWAESAPTAIVVNPAPSNVVAASGALTICAGNSISFTASSGAGYTYQWHNSAGAIMGATSISYTATASENYHVVITDGSGCITTTATMAVVVNPLPNVGITPSGPRIFCAGGIVLLSAAPGFNYQWYRNGPAIIGATSSNYTAALSGGYRVRVTDIVTGCTALTGADTVVSVVGTPVVSPLTPAKFCWGGSSLLSTSVSTLGSSLGYQWYKNGVLIPGATSSTYLATVAGDFSCGIVVPSSCSVTTSAVAVIEVPLPDPPITFNGLVFRTGNYYVSYQWYNNLIPISGATTSSTPATSNGSYKVAVTDTNGCQSVSAVYVLTGWTAPHPSGVVNVNSTDIKIFPNPANEKVFIEASIILRAVVSGVDGKTLIDKENARELNLKGLADGLYMITLYNEDGQQMMVQKLVKQ